MQLTTAEATLGVAIINTVGLVLVALVTRGHGRRITSTVEEVAQRVKTKNGHTIGELVEQTAETVAAGADAEPPAPVQRGG